MIGEYFKWYPLQLRSEGVYYTHHGQVFLLCHAADAHGRAENVAGTADGALLAVLMLGQHGALEASV